MRIEDMSVGEVAWRIVKGGLDDIFGRLFFGRLFPGIWR